MSVCLCLRLLCLPVRPFPSPGPRLTIQTIHNCASAHVWSNLRELLLPPKRNGPRVVPKALPTGRVFPQQCLSKTLLFIVTPPYPADPPKPALPPGQTESLPAAISTDWGIGTGVTTVWATCSVLWAYSCLNSDLLLHLTVDGCWAPAHHGPCGHTVTCVRGWALRWSQGFTEHQESFFKRHVIRPAGDMPSLRDSRDLHVTLPRRAPQTPQGVFSLIPPVDVLNTHNRLTSSKEDQP